MRFCLVEKHQARNERAYQSGGMWMHTMALYACLPIAALYPIFAVADVQSSTMWVIYLEFSIFFLFIPSMHAVIRSLTKNYCVFSFIVHSCKLQCLKCSVDECTYAREEREKKSFIYLCTWFCVFFCPTLDPRAQFLGYFLVSNWARIWKEWEGYLS